MKRQTAAAIILLLLAAIACAGRGTSVSISFKSTQVDADFSGRAAYALAVPRGKDLKVYLFADAGARCEDATDGAAIGELFIPSAPRTPWGAKFAPPDHPTWAASIDAGKRPPVRRLHRDAGSVSGCVDIDIDESSGGNSGRMKGCFTASLCPPKPVSDIRATRGSSDMNIRMTLPGGQWERKVGSAIAFLAVDRAMVFFQDVDRLDCENYRLVAKQGLVEFRYSEGVKTFGAADVVKASPVDPKTGWSLHYGPDQIKVLGAEASISPDGRRITGSIDLALSGIDPLTVKNVYGGRVPDGADRAGGSFRGTFDAPICPEF